MQDRARSRASASTIIWESMRGIIARSAVEAHPYAFLPSYDPEAIMLDFVEPQGTGRRAGSRRREAGGNETGRKRTGLTRRTPQHDLPMPGGTWICKGKTAAGRPV
jgi:hypothetical protein